jgi:nicotinamidase-related amidase
MTIPSSSVLIVVDAQVGFVTEHSDPTIPTIVQVLRRWQDAGGASVLTQFVNAPESSYVRLIGWSELMPGEPEVDLDPRVAPLAASATLVMPKGGYSAITDPFIELAKARGWTDLYITGLDTESCVLATALRAFELGFTPWVVTDACASHAGPTVHQAGVLVMGRFLGGGQLVTTTDLSTSALVRTAP